MRLDYETWIECTVPADRVRRCRAAEAKRARKAAKRRRDAELTRLGIEVARALTASRNAARPSSEHWNERAFWCEGAEANRARDRMAAIRRSKVAP